MTICEPGKSKLMADILPPDMQPDQNQGPKPPEPDVISVKPFHVQIVWFNAVGFLVLYVTTVYGLYQACFSSKGATLLWTFVLMGYAGFSTTIGAHRLFTHRSFKATTSLVVILIIGQTLAGQNCLWVWVRDHRQHHKFSDTDADPHNSKRGFFFSHVGWLMMKKHPMVIEKGRTIDMTDMSSDPFVMFQKRFYKSLFTLFGVLIPVAVPWYLWNETLFNCFIIALIVRLWVTNNIVWLVNSWAHWSGTKPYDRKIAAVESFWVSLLCLGEGWHNYHHAFPWDYRTSEAGAWPNASTRVIDWLQQLGLAYDLKAATDRMVARKMLRDGDGSHPLADLPLEMVIKYMGNRGKTPEEILTEREEDSIPQLLHAEADPAIRQHSGPSI
nr:PREDICTED: stearoyl-CoA desaturase 5-like [Bemisia tabaci]XP_018908119.1 PREDICTED: stearoyl-CoA desaturase 5-like [Bemisia tabaci]XP_018908120.1 PREDICTED: stearoyl-CoA desaturase 5-like [Bemisia tabaci]XP_018908121.1 PREDICTED: stearoyl-CoA desaturase 5-like [Bemisia tabaci]XP_018908122.1 PREDICTED: stearoyl-CoA desaturase 5-like [Bemisia tabaci]XP_018908123.1 PREDICTED: stearoyl-CoA desaturase 5-like [Bemisia tabaci]